MFQVHMAWDVGQQHTFEGASSFRKKHLLLQSAADTQLNSTNNVPGLKRNTHRGNCLLKTKHILHVTAAKHLCSSCVAVACPLLQLVLISAFFGLCIAQIKLYIWGRGVIVHRTDLEPAICRVLTYSYQHAATALALACRKQHTATCLP
jgi:hypothetical protein